MPYHAPQQNVEVCSAAQAHRRQKARAPFRRRVNAASPYPLPPSSLSSETATLGLVGGDGEGIAPDAVSRTAAECRSLLRSASAPSSEGACCAPFPRQARKLRIRFRLLPYPSAGQACVRGTRGCSIPQPRGARRMIESKSAPAFAAALLLIPSLSASHRWNSTAPRIAAVRRSEFGLPFPRRGTESDTFLDNPAHSTSGPGLSCKGLLRPGL